MQNLSIYLLHIYAFTYFGTHVYVSKVSAGWYEIASSERFTCVGSQDNKKQRLPPLQTKACFLRLFKFGILSWRVGVAFVEIFECFLKKHINHLIPWFIYFKFSEALSKQHLQIADRLVFWLDCLIRKHAQQLDFKSTSSRNHSWAGLDACCGLTS